MLLVVTRANDVLGEQIAAAARRAGKAAAIESDFVNLTWELRIGGAGETTNVLSYGKEAVDVDSIVYLGGTWSLEDGEFCANERMASWWALMAAFPGPVVNRPTQHGLSFTLDRLRIRSHIESWPFRWTLRDTAQARKHALIRSAERLQPAGTVLPGEALPEAEWALEIVECVPRNVQRFAVGGRRLTPIAPYHQGPICAVDKIRSSIRADLPALAVIVTEQQTNGEIYLLDVASCPSAALLGDAITPTLDGVLAAVQ